MTSLPAYCSADEAAEIYNRTQLAASSYAASWLDSEVIGDLRPFFLGLGPLPPYCSTSEYNEYINALKARQTVVQSEYLTNRLPLDLRAAIQSWTTYDFIATPSLPVGATLTRASTGWTFNSSGVLTSFANDVPRFAYNINGTFEGLLNEPAATNILRNTDTSMAVLGLTPSPGIFPTNWRNTLSSGITSTIIAKGTQNGMPYLDVRFQGSGVAGSSQYVFESANQAVLASTPYNASLFLALVGGTTANINPRITNFAGYNNLNAENTANPIVSLTVNNLTANLQRFDFPHLTIAGTTGISAPGLIIRHTIGQPIDLTLRVASPQHEQVATATSKPTSRIPTTAGAVTRAADILTLPLPAATYPAIYVTRVAGTTTYANQVVSNPGWVVPTDPSPIRQIVAVSP